MGSWNFNFMAVKHNKNTNYGLKIGQPRGFYDQLHRPKHFFDFAAGDDDWDISEQVSNFD